ncbi:restriction endonuclease subunit S [Aliarcobacter butzleri]|uniref:restriction endonuclease subunit S n=1 Tax=Aliarcobacter butzleri TaxID=28197 RepID=UPI00125F00B8|nr:restriction endonuclease subunit S [Aliarcobacter butzleri]
MKFIKVKLKDLCTPKQWKNLPIAALHENGKYKVYGANGVIGYYNEYNHEFPTLAITCRGATCGNVHITEPKSYITSNAMALDSLDVSKVDLKFLKYVLLKRGFYDVITGSAQPQITATNLNKIDLLIPEKLDDQQKIAQLLTQIEELINKREESINLLDELIKSTFLDMFGDPFNNKYSFDKCTIRDLVNEVKYGTSSPAVEGGKYPYLRMNNIDYNGYWDFNDIKFIDINDADKEKYSLKKGDLVFNRTNSKELVGKTAVYNLDKEVVIAGYLIRIRVNQDNNPWFVWGYLNSIIGKKVLFSLCRNIVGMANINAQELQNIDILKPPKPLQDKFAEVVTQVEQIKTFYQDSLNELNNLFGSIAQKAFKGELDVSKIELIQKEQEEITMAIKLDEKKLLEEIKKGDFEASKYVNEHQNYDAIKDMIFKLIEDGKISQELVEFRTDDEKISSKIELRAN